MKIKLNILSYDENNPEFHFEKFIFQKSHYYQNKYVFSLTGAFLPNNVCRRLEKYFGEIEFRSELYFDGYESEDLICEWEQDEEEFQYEDFYES